MLAHLERQPLAEIPGILNACVVETHFTTGGIELKAFHLSTVAHFRA